MSVDNTSVMSLKSVGTTNSAICWVFYNIYIYCNIAYGLHVYNKKYDNDNQILD